MKRQLRTPARLLMAVALFGLAVLSSSCDPPHCIVATLDPGTYLVSYTDFQGQEHTETIDNDGTLFALGHCAEIISIKPINASAACSLDCPRDMTVHAPPGLDGAQVDFATPDATCGKSSCAPSPGVFFPVGTSIVTCSTAREAGPLTCTFRVTVVKDLSDWDVCLQDDADPASVLFIDSKTHTFQFCCHGTTYSGTGSSSAGTDPNGVVTLTYDAPDLRVRARVDAAHRSGSAILQTPPGTTVCSIYDRNTLNNNCTCH